jgi:hypothetical protein
MDVAYVSALSALGGSIIGGMTSGITTWLNQRSQARAAHLDHELARRQDLYKDFVLEASKAYGQALFSNEPQIPELIALYAMIRGMRILSSRATVAAAERVMLATTAAYTLPNRTVSQLHEPIKTDAGIDPLREFAEAARDDLRSQFP